VSEEIVTSVFSTEKYCCGFKFSSTLYDCPELDYKMFILETFVPI